MRSIQSVLTAGFLGLFPAFVLFVIFVAWSKAALGAAAWFAKRVPPGTGDQKSATASFDFLGMKVENIPVAILVHILPAVALYLGVVWLLIPAAKTSLSAFVGPTSSIQLQTITGELMYSGDPPPDKVLLKQRPRPIEFPATKNRKVSFLIKNFPVNDNDLASTFIQITQGCLVSDEVSVSPDYYSKMDERPRVQIDSQGGLRLEPLLLESTCARVDKGPVPGGQSPPSIPFPATSGH